MSWRSALFEPGRMDQKTVLFLSESRMAHDRITNLLILTYPLLIGVWQFRETAKHFVDLASPVDVRNAVLSFIQFPHSESAVRRLDFKRSVADVTWERQRDATAEMMFLVCCSIFENFTSHLQDLVVAKSGQTTKNRPIEKGFQFPSTDYDFYQQPPSPINNNFSDKLSTALTYLPASPFMAAQMCPQFPQIGKRNFIDDLEMKLHTYLLFKKLRNSIAHGRFDQSIPAQYKIVDEIVTADGQGQHVKTSISTDGNGNYFLKLYDVIGFSFLLLNIIKDIDFLYLRSAYGESDLIERLRASKDSKQQGSANRAKDLTRLRLCLRSMGVHLQFQVDDAARAHFISKRVWR